MSHAEISFFASLDRLPSLPTGPLAFVSVWSALSDVLPAAVAPFESHVGTTAVAPGAPCWVRVHGGQLRAVLASLVTAACQTLASQRGTLSVAVEPTLVEDVILDDTAGRLNGGLPPRRYARIAILVERCLDAVPVAGDDGGLSAERLSLAEVRGIVETYKGSLVSACSTAGTRFEVFLPLMDAPGRVVGSSSGKARWHVLYIDDYDVMCDLAWDALTGEGYRVSCFQNPVEALATIAANPQAFDAAVIDVNMPLMSGFDLAREVVRITPGMPIVLISGEASGAMADRSREAGARALVSKSHALDSIVRAIDMVVNER